MAADLIGSKLVFNTMVSLPTPPSAWRSCSLWSPRRLWQWTLPRRYHETVARLRFTRLMPVFETAGAKVIATAGDPLPHTAVTTHQLDLLLSAVAATSSLAHPIIEIGSFRGITTRALAGATDRQIIAIDPYLGDGGHPKDLALFETHTAGLANVRLIRAASDSAFESWDGGLVSLVFIDAIHEYVHAWYDFAAWSSRVPAGGIVAFHDVDQFPGVNRVILHLLQRHQEWTPWGYAPNIALFQRV
jgi:predicted O-methyltransferase YrrM